MGMPCATIGSSTFGHSCWPSTKICAGSPDTISEALPTARVGDPAIPHTCTIYPYPTHGLKVAQGSSTVIINGRGAARIGDRMACGDKISSGRSSVIVG